MLEQVAHWNKLSIKLRDRLTKKIEALGNRAEFKFAISNKNPDPEKYNGEILWPGLWTLGPVTFDITDKDEDRPGESKQKKIGLIAEVDKDGKPSKFKRIQVREKDAGRLRLDLTNPEDVETCAAILLHPCLKNGEFADKNKRQVVELVDLNKESLEKRKARDARLAAVNVAKQMSDDEVRRFASAMVWDDTEDIGVLREQIEATAEESPDMFTDLVNSKAVEYQSNVKRAIDQNILSVDPVSGKYVWVGNNQTLATLGVASDGNHIKQLSEFFITGGKNAEEAYKKVKALLK